MIVVVIAQQKGGVGKTTSTANIGAALAMRGFRTLLVDCDPQGSLTLSMGIDPIEVTRTIGDAMLLGADVPTVNCCIPGLDLCPATRLLADVEFQLAARVGRERYLRRSLARVDGHYDYAILDSPPSLGLLTINCLAAAHWCFVPVTPTLLGTAGLRDLLATAEEVRDGINPELRIGGVFVTFADYRTVAGRRLDAELREDLGARVMESTIGRRIAHEYGAQAGLPVVCLEPGSIAAQEYQSLTEEVLSRVHVQAAQAA